MVKQPQSSPWAGDKVWPHPSRGSGGVGGEGLAHGGVRVRSDKGDAVDGFVEGAEAASRDAVAELVHDQPAAPASAELMIGLPFARL